MKSKRQTITPLHELQKHLFSDEPQFLILNKFPI